MIGLDTNILVRHIAQDDAAQSPRATKLIESFTDERPGYVALVVLVETIWVFQRRYDATRSDIARLIETLLRIDGIRVEHPEIVWAATPASPGASRSGDIEQTILLGAHGPRRLHVLVVEG